MTIDVQSDVQQDGPKDVEVSRGGGGQTPRGRPGIDFFNHLPQPIDDQIGGQHYLSLNPQPFDVVRDCNLSHAEGEILYHLIRHKMKNGKGDLLKCIHWLTLIIQSDYPDDEGK